MRPGEPVGLEDDVDLPVAALARRGQRGANLRGMVAVVVHHRNAARLAALLEAPVHAAKVAEPLGNLFRRNLKLVRDGHRGRGVQHIVASGHVQLEGPQRPARRVHQETRKALPCAGALQETQAGNRPLPPRRR